MEDSILPVGEMRQSIDNADDNNRVPVTIMATPDSVFRAPDDIGSTTPHVIPDHQDSRSPTVEEKLLADGVVNGNTATLDEVTDDSSGLEGIEPPTLGAVLDHHEFTQVTGGTLQGKRRQTLSTFRSNISVMTNVSLQQINPNYANPDRTVSPHDTLCHVGRADAWRRGFDETRDTLPLTAQEQDRRMYSFASKMIKRQESVSRRELVFCRFERLSVFNILRAQHKLVLLSEKLHYDEACDGFDDPSFDCLGEALQEYVRAIESFQVLDSKKAPEPSSVKPMAANLAHKLHEPHYWDGPDALNLFDIAGAHEALPSRKRRSLLWESKLSFCRQMM